MGGLRSSESEMELNIHTVIMSLDNIELEFRVQNRVQRCLMGSAPFLDKHNLT